MVSSRAGGTPRQIPFGFAQGRLSPRWRVRALFGMTLFKTRKAEFHSKRAGPLRTSLLVSNVWEWCDMKNGWHYSLWQVLDG